MFARPLDDIVAALNRELDRDDAPRDRLALVSVWDAERFADSVYGVSGSEWDAFAEWMAEQSILDENQFMEGLFERYLESKNKANENAG